MKSCDGVRARLTAYLDGDLDPERGTLVRGHLRTCDACRQIAADEAALRDGLRALPTVDPPPSLWANVQARLAEVEVAESQRPAWRRMLARWMPSPQRLALGGAVAAAAVTLTVWRVSSRDAEPVAPRIADHPSPAIESSATPAPAPRPPTPPSADDATAELLAEPARITATYEATANELLALAADARPGWTDAAKATFDARIADFQRALTASAVDERMRHRTYRAMIRYVQNAVVRDEIVVARVP